MKRSRIHAVCSIPFLLLGVNAASADLSTVYDFYHYADWSPAGSEGSDRDGGVNPLIPLESTIHSATLTVSESGIFTGFGFAGYSTATYAGGITFSVDEDSYYASSGWPGNSLTDLTTGDLLYAAGFDNWLWEKSEGSSTGLLLAGHDYEVSWYYDSGKNSPVPSGSYSLSVQTIPVPSAVLLGVIGLGMVGWLRRRLF